MRDIVAEVRKNFGFHGGTGLPPADSDIRAILRAALEATGVDGECRKATPAALRHLEIMHPEAQAFYMLLAAAYPEHDKQLKRGT